MLPELSDGRITLRPPSPDDVAGHLLAVSESLPALSEWLPWATPGYQTGQSSSWIAHCQEQWTEAAAPEVHLEFHIFEHGRLVGASSITPKRGGSGEIGYWVRTSAVGRGICTAAVRLLVAYGFDVLQLDGIHIRVDAANHSSRRVAMKVGAVERPSRDIHTDDDGTRHELVVFDVPRPETPDS